MADILSNAEEILNLKSGDESTFETVYKQYYSRLCAFARQFIQAEECEEVVQDTMMWLWENRESLIPEMQLKSLLFTIVKNKCLNVVTHSRIRDSVHEKICAKYRKVLEDPDTYMTGELENILERALKEFPEEFSETFCLNRFECKTYDEIALLKGVSRQTVAYRMSRALALLRTAFSDYLHLLIIVFFKMFSGLYP